jgi:hypothetical protein
VQQTEADTGRGTIIDPSGRRGVFSSALVPTNPKRPMVTFGYAALTGHLSDIRWYHSAWILPWLSPWFLHETSWHEYSYTRGKDVGPIFGDMVSFWYIWCCFVSSPCEDLPFLYIFHDSLDLCKLAKIKAAKSHICIIDRAGHEIPLYNCRDVKSISPTTNPTYAGPGGNIHC